MRRYTIKINDTVHTLDVEEISGDQFTVHLADGRLVDATLLEHRDLAQARIAPSVEIGAPRVLPDAVAVATQRPAAPAPAPADRPPGGAPSGPARQQAGAGSGTVTAPMPGVVLAVQVAPGSRVARGQTLLVLEAMKMKNELKAERAAVVAQVLVAAGDHVRHGDLLVEFEG